MLGPPSLTWVSVYLCDSLPFKLRLGLLMVDPSPCLLSVVFGPACIGTAHWSAKSEAAARGVFNKLPRWSVCPSYSLPGVTQQVTPKLSGSRQQTFTVSHGEGRGVAGQDGSSSVLHKAAGRVLAKAAII